MLFIVSACGPRKKSDTLIIWHDKEVAIEQVIYDAVKKELPEMKIELIRKESMTDTLKLVGNNKNAAPDMYIFAHDKIGLFAEIGILAPITEFISQEKLNAFMPLTLDAATYKGTIYQLPFYFETLLFMYNKDRMSENEVPETTEDLYQYMQRTTNSRRYGFVEQHANAYYSAGWIHGFGGSILKNDGTPGLNSPETIQALEYKLKFIELMPKGQSEYATINTLFFEKIANSIIAGPWIVPQVRERGIDLGFAPMPIVNQTGLPIAPYAGIQGIHVLKVAAQDPERKEKIEQLIHVLSNPEIGIKMALESGVAPAHQDAYLDDRIIRDELVLAMKIQAQQAIPMPNLPEMDIMWITATEMLVNINLRGNAVTTEANNAQKKSQDLINSMR
jgi:arabinogalactan oligomer / maltooligosaccharide transport system substrate-binding protein